MLESEVGEGVWEIADEGVGTGFEDVENVEDVEEEAELIEGTGFGMCRSTQADQLNTMHHSQKRHEAESSNDLLLGS